MATRKKPARPIEQLLAKELPGEAIPGSAELKIAVSASLALAKLEPWGMLNDSCVFAFDSDSGQRWYATLMGALGQVFGLQAFRGDAGFAMFDDIQQEHMTSTDFLTRQDLFSIEYVPRVELSVLDKAILALAPESAAAARRLPKFTVSRPRRMLWYPNAAEVAEINDGLMAALVFLHWLRENPRADPWAKPGFLPLLLDWGQVLRIDSIPYPARPASVDPASSPAKMDERAVNRLLPVIAKRKAGSPLEVDTFLFPAAVGDAGRPYFPFMTLVCDSASGFVLPPGMSSPEESRADALGKGLLQALEASPFWPEALHVADEATRAILAPLAQALGLPLHVAELPALSEARTGILQRIG